MVKQVLTTIFDPTSEPVPLPQQSFVGNLNGRRPTPMITIKGQETEGPEPVEHSLEIHGVYCDGHDL